GISGASRELSEGFGALLAAVVLVWVGIWMHGKGQADAWQRYVREKLGQALGRGSGLFLLALVFVVVYREVFETILFFAALWGQGSRSSVVAGGAAGALALAVVGWALMRWSRRLPIARFFRYSAILIAVLAVVLAGKAVSALQEAGWLPVTWLDGWPRLEWLGLSPTLLGVAVQLLVVAVLVAGFAWSGRTARGAAACPAASATPGIQPRQGRKSASSAETGEGADDPFPHTGEDRPPLPPLAGNGRQLPPPSRERADNSLPRLRG